MRAGSLRERVTLYRLDRSARNAFNEVVPSLVTVDTNVAASVTQKGSRERYLAQQVSNESTHTVVIRYRSDVGTDWLVGYYGHNYQIDGVVVDTKRESLTLSCVLVTS